MKTAEINVKKKRLLSYKQIIANNESAVIGTHNKNTGWDGCAIFCKDDQIKVFEGNSDGSNDTIMSYYHFVKNYSFSIGVEMRNGSIGEFNYEN